LPTPPAKTDLKSSYYLDYLKNKNELYNKKILPPTTTSLYSVIFARYELKRPREVKIKTVDK
jgi:hypothetical protein